MRVTSTQHWSCHHYYLKLQEKFLMGQWWRNAKIFACTHRQKHRVILQHKSNAQIPPVICWVVHINISESPVRQISKYMHPSINYAVCTRRTQFQGQTTQLSRRSPGLSLRIYVDSVNVWTLSKPARSCRSQQQAVARAGMLQWF